VNKVDEAGCLVPKPVKKRPPRAEAPAPAMKRPPPRPRRPRDGATDSVASPPAPTKKRRTTTRDPEKKSKYYG